MRSRDMRLRPRNRGVFEGKALFALELSLAREGAHAEAVLAFDWTPSYTTLHPEAVCFPNMSLAK